MNINTQTCNQMNMKLPPRRYTCKKMKDRLGFRFVLCSAVFMILTQHRALANSHGYTITNDHKLYLRIILQEEKT